MGSSSPVMHIHNYPFEDQDIVLDFHEFKECKFTNCNMIYHGHGAVGLISCKFHQCKWVLDGPAKATLNFMANMYSNGNGAEELIDATFQKIKNGEYL